MAANRIWRVTGSFHKMADSVVTVTAPNLVGGIRKGALTIKRLPQMKGKRLVAGSFTIHEVDREMVRESSEQLSLPSGEPSVEVASEGQGTNQEPEPGKG